MNLLFRIVYATQAKGTHHKLALDALRHLGNKDAEAWARVFLKHAGLYLEGSKAPDDEFKDFKNHVLHVRDNYWGGAPEKVQSWYGHLVEALRRQDWPQAAYAAGVMSHYYTDPIMPLHTAQSEAENNVHRAIEWSINRSYDALRAEGEKTHAHLVVAASPGAHWLKDLVIQGAETANPHYEKLITHYDLHAGVVDPPSGLDAIMRPVISELLMYAAKGVALILDRAIAESGAVAPDVALTAETLIATLAIPLKLLQKKLADAGERAQVERMYDELISTGRVEKALPEDDRIIRDLYSREVLAPRAAERAAERARRLPNAASAAKPRPVRYAAASAPPSALAGAAAQRPVEAQPPPRQRPAAATAAPAAIAIPRELPRKVEELSVLGNPRRTFLKPGDDIEAAPTIGPKLAERLAVGGLSTVGDLLAADPHVVAMKLGDRRITDATIVDWQDQARLVMSVPGLRGGHAQLLVGAGYRNAEAIRDAEAGKLCADILAFSTTAEGQRLLRDSAAPDIEKIKGWIESAATALAA